MDIWAYLRTRPGSDLYNMSEKINSIDRPNSKLHFSIAGIIGFSEISLIIL